jgi:hypothetical protein
MLTDLGNASNPIIPDGIQIPEKPKGSTFPSISRNRLIVGSAFCIFVVSGRPEGTGDEVRLASEFALRAFGLCEPAAPTKYPNIWNENKFFSKHETLWEALDAFDRCFPQHALRR